MVSALEFNSVPTVNTGDFWTAANHNLYIGGNFDLIDQSQFIEFTPTVLWVVPLSGSGLTEATRVYLYDSVFHWPELLFDAASPEYVMYQFPAPRGFANVARIYCWYAMASVNVAKDVRIQVYFSGVSDGDDYDDQDWDVQIDETFRVVQAADTLAMFVIIPTENIFLADDHVVMRFSRQAGHGEDTASGDLRLLRIMIEYRLSGTD